MKKILLAFILLVSLTNKAQTFSFNKMSANGTMLFQKGKIILTDSTFTIKGKNINQTDKIKKILDNQIATQFKGIDTPEDMELRISLNKKGTKTITYTARNNFANQIATIIYFIKEQKE